MSEIAIFGPKKAKFCKNGTPEKTHFSVIGSGIDHYGGIGTKISPLSVILISYKQKGMFFFMFLKMV